MKTGKVSEVVLKRSVMSQIQKRREEVIIGAGVGEDCAAVALAPEEVLVISTDPITGTTKDIGLSAMHITANDLASSGAEPIGVMLTILLPEGFEEPGLKAMMKELETAAESLHMEIMGGHTEVTPVVNQPLISVAGVGKIKRERLLKTGGARPGQDVVLTKWIGIEGTAIIAKEKEETLRQRFSAAFVEQAKSFDQYISVVPEAKIAMDFGVEVMHDVTEGGIFGALWEVAEASGVGLDVDLKKIPIRQETVEVCEVFDVNPYFLISSGAMLIITEHGHDLAEALARENIPAAVIGKVTEGRDRIVRNEEEVRYLEPPRQDALYKL